MKVTPLLLLAIAALIVGLSGCASENDSFVTSFKEKATHSLDSNHPEVNLTSLTDFAWDRIHIFGPYTPAKTVKETLGYDWPEADRTGLEMSDSFNLLVFERKGRVVKHFKVPRSIDFEGIAYPFRAPVGGSSFHVRRVSAGNSVRLILSLIPKEVVPLEDPIRR